jgi:hypothetical protein
MKIIIYTDGRRFAMTSDGMMMLGGGEIEREIEFDAISDADTNALLEDPYNDDLIDKLPKKA